MSTTISSFADITTWIANENPGGIWNPHNQDPVTELAEKIRDAAHPPYGADWSEWLDAHAEVFAAEVFYKSRAGSEAVPFEQMALSIGDDLLPECARTVRDGGAPTLDYWRWLIEQHAKADATPEAVDTE